MQCFLRFECKFGRDNFTLLLTANGDMLCQEMISPLWLCLIIDFKQHQSFDLVATLKFSQNSSGLPWSISITFRTIITFQVCYIPTDQWPHPTPLPKTPIGVSKFVYKRNIAHVTQNTTSKAMQSKPRQENQWYHPCLDRFLIIDHAPSIVTLAGLVTRVDSDSSELLQVASGAQLLPRLDQREDGSLQLLHTAPYAILKTHKMSELPKRPHIAVELNTFSTPYAFSHRSNVLHLI